MICPFCAEEIRDKALVCRYCHRDLAVVQNLITRVAALEGELAQARSELSALRQAETKSLPSPKPLAFPVVPASRLAITVVSCIFLYWVGFYLMRFPVFQPKVLFFFMLVSPFLFGIWLGIRYALPIKRYLLAGGLIGFVVTISTTWYDILKNMVSLPFHTYAKSLDFYIYSLGLILTFALLITSGGLTGRLIQRWRSREQPSAYATRLAVQFVSQVRSRGPSGSTIQRLGNLIHAFAPILTFIASLASAYLAYSAAMAPRMIGK